MKKPSSGGGWQAIWYTFRKAREAGGFWKMWKALRSKNSCKTCAVGMGGQQGGMVNELGRFPEVCKKSLQAMAADMQGAIASDFWSTYSLAQLRQFTPRQLEYCGRLVEPVLVRRDEQYYQPISWEEAAKRIVDKLKATAADETFWYFSGRSSNEAGFLLQLFARMYGTNHVNNCSFYCHQASGVGLNSSVGTGTATVLLEDLEKTDLVFVIGGNPPSNHPRLMTTLRHVRKRGGKVIVINPVVETGLVNFRVPSSPWSMLFGTEIASTYVQPHIGGDLALLTGIAKHVVSLRAHDPSFVADHCRDGDEYLAALDAVSWEELEQKSGVSITEMKEIAEIYAQAKNAVFTWTMGITHHAHGVQNVQAIANLALLRGMVGRPHAGLLPIRGHSNVQGIGSVGVTPTLKQAIFDSLQSEYGVTLPTTPGFDTLACMEASAEGRMKFGLCLGGNLYGSNPDAEFADKALANLDMLVMLNTTLNTGHAHGLARETIILPVLARDEEPEATTQESMFNFVRVSDGGPSRLDGPRSEIAVISELAAQVLGSSPPIEWNRLGAADEIRKMIATVVPGYQAVKDVGQTKKEFQIAGRTFHKPQFPTADGLAQLHVHEIPELRGGGEQYRLMTVRSEGQFNTVVYEETDIYRGQDRRDVILMHPDDIATLPFSAGEPVRVSSDVGHLDVVLTAYEDIRAGNVLMYYPEANVLVPRVIDQASRTPAFKGTLVTIQPIPEAT